MACLDWIRLLQKYRVIAVIRSPQFHIGWQMAKSVIQGGVQLVEITWNSEFPEQLIAQLRSDFPESVIGAGTLLTLEDLQRAVDAGSQFLFSPHTNSQLIRAANQAGVPIVPGAFSPTEIVTAWQAGADCVKVFPISALGGATYLKSLKGPLGQIPLIPTGGIRFDNAQGFLAVGAVAVGLSSDFFPKSLVETENWPAITQRTAQFLETISSRMK
ncbi:MAG: bifunctional 4-hydroxy-2-oxoglutarate aldolase/2-dehydro-3-deoxy-phosphogluconate aldolase [Microcoleaceae cyanobacterium]